MKGDLEKLSKQPAPQKHDERKSCRIANVFMKRRECGRLEEKCFFCKKVTKYVKGENAKENLCGMTEMHAWDSAIRASKIHND